MKNLKRLEWMLWLGLILGLIGIAIACTTKETAKVSEVKSAPPLDEAEKKRLEEVKMEMEVGRNMAGRLLEFYGVHEDQKLVRYLNEIAGVVASNSDFPDRRYMIDVIKSEQPNAFACPGGYILLTLGSIKNARNEAELAAVIGHEIAHVGRQHMIETLRKMDQKELDEAANPRTQEAAQIPKALQVRKRPDPEKSETVSAIARYVAGSVAGLNILQAAKAGMSIMLEKGLGADLEFDADREGIKYAVNSGYHPFAFIDYLCRIEVSRGRSKEDCFRESVTNDKQKTILDKTHPPIAQRITRLRSTLKEMDASSIVGAHGKRRFIHYQRRLTQDVKD